MQLLSAFRRVKLQSDVSSGFGRVDGFFTVGPQLGSVEDREKTYSHSRAKRLDDLVVGRGDIDGLHA